MLKYGQLYLMPLIHKLFNLVFPNGIYPKSWSIGYITPLHQSGSVYDPSNYRGITIGDCLGQIFNRILNNRLVCFLEKNYIINKEQTGFVKGCHKSDHMFTLKTLIHKYVKSHSKPIYMLALSISSEPLTQYHMFGFYTNIRKLELVINFTILLKICITTQKCKIWELKMRFFSITIRGKAKR